ncbi:MAG TPA: hypothetical protein VG347_21345 [Verrucomicrobiae bacterium]|nr:hypothetical protein [Verrucomicrobiae bacterium]
MSTVAEITNALSGLSTEELQSVESALISIYRQRKTGIIYDDSYGVWTEEDQVAAAGQAFVLMEEAEKKSPQKRQQ